MIAMPCNLSTSLDNFLTTINLNSHLYLPFQLFAAEEIYEAVTTRGSQHGDHTMGITPWDHTMGITPWESLQGITPWGSQHGDHSMGITPKESHHGDHTMGITPWGSLQGITLRDHSMGPLTTADIYLFLQSELILRPHSPN